MNKLRTKKGYAKLTLDESPGIRSYRVRVDEDQQEWTFPELVDILRKQITRIPKIILEKGSKRENAYETQTNNKNYKHHDCAHCQKSVYKVSDCKTVTNNEERRLILSKKNLFQFYWK